MKIKLLADDLINKIAAGEVVERPASVVKELVENAIDAGAQNIVIKVSQAGMESIEVEDDGKGMMREEIPIAFMRHATSKISEEKDLYNITTMGFRGEALPSIASVSKVDIYSCSDGEEGVWASLEGGVIKSIDYYPCPKGTRIIVRDIFYNTPARRKFLKSPVSEGNHIFDLIIKYALSHPDISFTYRSDKRTYFKTPGNGILRDAVLTIYGTDFLASLIDVKYSGQNYHIKGLISRPEIRKNNRKNQLFFINSRPVKSNLLYRAIDTAYKGLLLSREYPVVILSVIMPPSEIDVNVHPQKTEVRFKDEQQVFRLVYQVLREYLDKLEYEAVWGFSGGKKTISDYYNDTNNKENWYYENKKEEKPYITENNFIFEEKILNKDIKAQRDEILNLALNKKNDLVFKDYKILGQLLKGYILVEKDSALYIIDQHAAHERILYDQLKKDYADRNHIAQALAIPLSLQLSPDKLELMEHYLPFLKELGFELDIISYNSAVLRAAPAFTRGKELEILEEMLDSLKEGKKADFLDKTLIMMACKKAVKAGDNLSLVEMEKIAGDLLSADNCKNCPHGRPAILKITEEELNNMFKR